MSRRTALQVHRPFRDRATAALGEVGMMMRSACWPVSKLRRLPRPAPRPGRHPVVTVHGLYGHAEMMRPLARRLLAEGWPQVVRVGWSALRCDLEDIARTVEAAVVPLAEHGPVDLVGHSLGAVACRAWMKTMGGDALVRRFVSLGGPHAGTNLYRVAPRRLREALDPQGPWVARLNADAEPVPTAVIRARYDRHVFPPERANIPGIEEHVIRTSGHNGLLWSRQAHDIVIAFLLD